MAHKAVLFDEDEFANLFFQLSHDFDQSLLPKPLLKKNPFEKLKDAEDLIEAEISARMTSAVNDLGLVPGLLMALCENAPDPLVVDESGQKIDAALFPSDLTPTDGRPHWSDQALPIEFKRCLKRYDPFDDLKEEVEATAEVQQRVYLFMILVMGRQVRLLRWDRSGVAVSKAFDYYERWEFFCDILWRISFLHRFRPHSLGTDPSATRIFESDPDWLTMDSASQPTVTDVDHTARDLQPDELTSSDYTFAYVRKMFRLSLQEGWPRYRLEVPDGDTVREYLVARPYFRAKGMTGRGTRGYVALECGTGLFRWLKDAWRVDYESVELEGDTLQELNNEGILFVPTLVCHGDILKQKTKTPDYWLRKNSPPPDLTWRPLTASTSSFRTLVKPAPSTSAGSKRKRTEDEEGATIPPPKGIGDAKPSAYDDCPLRMLAHYRVVVKEVCMPLSMFTNGQHLVTVIVDCLTAHYMASQVGILHRDVSGGNILIYPIIDETVDDATGITTRDLRWAGILTDWELSKKLDGPHIARQPERTGTWQFMSVAILTNRYKVVEVTDDLESFLYVLLYHAIRYLQSNCINVGDWIEEFFDCFTVTTAGSYSCGEKKFLTITVSARLTAPSVGNISLSPPMDYLLSELLRSFRAYYAVKAYDARKKLYSYAPTTDPAPSTSLGSKLPPPRRRKRPVPVKAIAESEKVEYVPTQAERDLAGNVAEHSGMITLLLNALEMDGWGDKDKVRDRIPDDWQPKKPLGPSVMSSVGKSKKRRLQGPGSMPSL